MLTVCFLNHQGEWSRLGEYRCPLYAMQVIDNVIGPRVRLLVSGPFGYFETTPPEQDPALLDIFYGP